MYLKWVHGLKEAYNGRKLVMRVMIIMLKECNSIVDAAVSKSSSLRVICSCKF
jgi:hypothetical protein